MKKHCIRGIGEAENNSILLKFEYFMKNYYEKYTETYNSKMKIRHLS